MAGTVPGTVWLANPRGFCAGVERAIKIIEELLAEHDETIYVKHEIVHNKRVIDGFTARGVRFIEDLADVPEGAILVFSAHGVAQATRHEAASRQLHVIDATCPLVTKIHAKVRRMHAAGMKVIMVGHRGHPEVLGTMGQVADGAIQLVEDTADVARLECAADDKLAFVTQTTLSVSDTEEIASALRERFPGIQQLGDKDICYATENRQVAVKQVAGDCEVVLVVGSRNSSNSNRLCEVAENCGARAHLVDGASDIEPHWLAGASRVLVTAGASAPEEVVREVVDQVGRICPGTTVEELPGELETVRFSAPRNMARGRAGKGMATVAVAS